MPEFVQLAPDPNDKALQDEILRALV